MIRYTLNCDRSHTFESWFQNSAAYDKQAKRKLIACPMCDSTKIEKAIMAPRLGRTDAAETSGTKLPTRVPPAPAQGPVQGPMQGPAQGPLAVMSAPERELRKKLKELREHITKNADYVGPRFPEQARKIHYGEIEHRSIYGEASREEAKELQEEGIDFHPLPILPEEFN